MISGAIGYLSQLFHLDAAGVGWAAGCALVGCIAGCAAAGTVADYLGKKNGLALCALCFALSSVGMLSAADLHQFVLWRVIGGLGIGAASVISPNYIAEIAPTRVRGRGSRPTRRTHRLRPHGRAPLSSILVAANKAWTAARERKPTKDIGEKMRDPLKGFDIAFCGDSRFVGWGGGIPIRKKGEVVGAIGVSGLSSAEDVALANVGLELIAAGNNS